MADRFFPTGEPYPRCKMCGRNDVDVELQPSRSQILFGGFRSRMENRCAGCEKKVAKWVDKLLDSPSLTASKQK